MADDVEIIEKPTVFQGYFHIDRYIVRHRLYDGGWSGPISREIFERGHATSVLCYDPERDVVGLVEQFRAGALAAGWNPWLVELVAGIIDEGETPENVARREAEEEAGAVVTDLVPVHHYLVTPGGSSETMIIYCGRIDSTKFKGTHGLPEEGEDIRALTLPADEAFAWVADGRICNSMTIIALQWLALNRQSLRAKWLA